MQSPGLSSQGPHSGGALTCLSHFQGDWLQGTCLSHFPGDWLQATQADTVQEPYYRAALQSYLARTSSSPTDSLHPPQQPAPAMPGLCPGNQHPHTKIQGSGMLRHWPLLVSIWRAFISRLPGTSAGKEKSVSILDSQCKDSWSRTGPA